ncbi:hypothetical protein [Natrialba sp. INN-245]|uniref:hypothetical protein n=1 Tax=Natrialba sp. INN-245 TaxID=2690967 RepID=UPI0013109F12|nr:hypothetical protein [Natrialba sp. INN-245]MWV40135.1 hypothetical protein [Natrialba sp. INN-245]
MWLSVPELPGLVTPAVIPSDYPSVGRCFQVHGPIAVGCPTASRFPVPVTPPESTTIPSMSTNDEYQERRISLLEDRVEPEYLEGLTDESGESNDVDRTKEILEGYDEALLSNEDAVADEIERLERKMEALGGILPKGRREDLQEQLETLRAVLEATNRFLDNTPEALAERINQ